MIAIGKYFLILIWTTFSKTKNFYKLINNVWNKNITQNVFLLKYRCEQHINIGKCLWQSCYDHIWCKYNIFLESDRSFSLYAQAAYIWRFTRMHFSLLGIRLRVHIVSTNVWTPLPPKSFSGWGDISFQTTCAPLYFHFITYIFFKINIYYNIKKYWHKASRR